MPRARNVSGGSASGFSAAASFGFSTKSTTVPKPSVCNSPNSEASRAVTGVAATVMSALEARCVSMISLIVHRVELIARQNEDGLGVAAEEVVELLAHRVGRALVPVHAGFGLLRREDLDEAARERVEAIGARYVAVQATPIGTGTARRSAAGPS